jgi:acetate kinase
VEVVILAVNCGSSSLKYALFADEVVRGSIAIGGGVPDHAAAVHAMFDKLGKRPRAVGHRVVHGGPEHWQPARVDGALLAALRRAVPFAPLHLPVELSAIEAVTAHFGDIPQVVCFDTAFHRTLPEVAWRVPLPVEPSVRRYGFHGLSYEYVAGVVGIVPRAIFAHLGSGASMVALRDGRAIDTTMGMTPAGGLVMGTRPGDLDPGMLVYLLENGLSIEALAKMIDHDAGLRALGGTSDMKELVANPRASLAVDVFCYQARKWIGALAAALGGVDRLVFTGGIGEHAAPIRARICDGLGHLGIALDDGRNATNAGAIGSGACDVRVIATDEESVIARHTQAIVGG